MNAVLAENAPKKATISRRSLEAVEEVFRRWKEDRENDIEVIGTKTSVVRSPIHSGKMEDKFILTITFRLKGRAK